MNDYLLFGGADYYPEGGWRDLITEIEAESDDAAKQIARSIFKHQKYKPDWSQLIRVSDCVEIATW
jgi:hypothetical protein